jgi:hypothetical protein
VSGAPAAGEQRSAVTIGVFDGLHLGHRALLDRTVAHARRRGDLAFDRGAGKDVHARHDDVVGRMQSDGERCGHCSFPPLCWAMPKCAPASDVVQERKQKAPSRPVLD